MTCEHLSRLLPLLLALCAARAAGDDRDARNFQGKASIVMREEAENPKCFIEAKSDFMCFWVEDEERAGPVEQYSFTYFYQSENATRCPLTVVPAADGKKMFVCHLNEIKMFNLLDIKVCRGDRVIHHRSLLVELVFLLDPPSNVTVRQAKEQGQLSVSWIPPYLKYMDDSMVYQVLYGAVHGPGKQIKEVMAKTQLDLRGLQAGSKYSVQVRVKLDGIVYSGFWSSWTKPVLMDTLPAEIDPLMVSLIVSITFILVLLSLAVLLSHQRFLLKKIWPTIPTPDSKFQGLFTVYEGNFQEWLGQTSGGLWSTSAPVASEGRPSPLEVLSELSLSPALQSPPLPPKAPRAPTLARKEEDAARRPDHREPLVGGDSALPEWRPAPRDPWLMERLRALQQHPVPRSQSSLLESHDAYVMLDANHHSEDEHLDDALEETLPLEVLFAGRKTTPCESHSDLGSARQSSGSGRLSSQSSFEYPSHAWGHRGPGYAYMAVADSGVSMDYSPMSRVDDIGKPVVYANDYRNDLAGHRRPALARQHPVHGDG